MVPFYRQKLSTTRRHESYNRLRLPFMDATKEDAYLRPEASWKNMLLQQPPSSHIGIIEISGTTESPDYTEMALSSRRSSIGYIRMKNLDTGVSNGILLPSQGRWVFWSWITAGSPNMAEMRYQHERDVAGERYLEDCAFVVITGRCGVIFRHKHIHTGLDEWIDCLGIVGRVEGKYHLPIWNF